MPLYEFTCTACGHTFEELYTSSELEAGKAKCPACKSKKVKRGFSAFATGGSDGSTFSGGGGGCGPGGFT